MGAQPLHAKLFFPSVELFVFFRSTAGKSIAIFTKRYQQAALGRRCLISGKSRLKFSRDVGQCLKIAAAVVGADVSAGEPLRSSCCRFCCHDLSTIFYAVGSSQFDLGKTGSNFFTSKSEALAEPRPT